MSGKMDQVKGRLEEAAGVITDNDRLKRQGKLDQAVGKVKETAARGAEKVKEKVERAGGRHEERLRENQPGHLPMWRARVASHQSLTNGAITHDHI